MHSSLEVQAQLGHNVVFGEAMSRDKKLSPHQVSQGRLANTLRLIQLREPAKFHSRAKCMPWPLGNELCKLLGLQNSRRGA